MATARYPILLIPMLLSAVIGCREAAAQSAGAAAPPLVAGLDEADDGGATAERSTLIDRIRRSIVAVGLRTWDEHDPNLAHRLGTGFIADQNCTIVTARHVLAGVDAARLVVSGVTPDRVDYTAEAETLWVDPRQDLALIELPAVREGEVRCSDLGSPALLAAEPATTRLLGRPIAIVGYPNLSDVLRVSRPIPVVRVGAVSAAGIRWEMTAEGQVYEDAPMLLLDTIGVPGFSGSPVVLADEERVIGVLLGAGVTSPSAGFVWASEISAPEYERMLAAPRLGSSPADSAD